MSEPKQFNRRPRRGRSGAAQRPPRPPDRELGEGVIASDADAQPAEVAGILDVLPDGYGFLRTHGYAPHARDVYVARSQIDGLHLRWGDHLAGTARPPLRAKEQFAALVHVGTVNGLEVEAARTRPSFDDLPAPSPSVRLRLEHPAAVSARMLDLFAPIGAGQRGMVVAPPKAGKTTVLRDIAEAVITNHPDMRLIVLLVDERPEEAFDWAELLGERAEVVASTFDRPLHEHLQVAELVLERAKRRAELGEDVMILLDSLTRMARTYNLAAPASGRILTGGIDASALDPPKRFFGAARDLRDAGSLTIVASCLVETGSRMDDVIFEEFKGRGNMEIKLERALAEKRFFPAINVEGTGTRNEERLLSQSERAGVWRLRRVLHAIKPEEAIEVLLENMRQTATNEQFLERIAKVG